MFNIVRPILYCELETVTGSNCIFCIRKGITITMDVSKQSMMSKFASSFMYYFGMVSISIKKTAYKKREISYFIFDMYISKVNYHYSIAIFLRLSSLNSDTHINGWIPLSPNDQF